MKFTLRHYQAAAIEATFDAWRNRNVQRAALVLPTGAGKTIIFSEICSRAVREDRRRPLILVHRDELVSQAAAKLRDTDPGLSVGIIKAELHEIKADVCIASVQSLARRLGIGKRGIAADRFDTIITDEAHHGVAQSYVSIYKHFGGLPDSVSRLNSDSDTLMLGVSATLARSDGVPLGHLWQEVVYEYSINQAMAEGFLVPVSAQRAIIQDLDLSKVKSIGGDWSDGELGAVLFKSGNAIAESIFQHGLDATGRVRRGIVFAPTVACAEMWADDFRNAGIRCRVVTGKTPIETRHAAYLATAAGENDLLVSVGVLIEGFDLPSVELCVMGRPTKSLVLYTQAVGRVLRPSPDTGKTSALVLDICGVMNDRLTTLVDLGLPPACDCACNCDFEYLCPQLCRCPRTKKGKLCKPCVICKRAWMTQPRAEREACPHYVAGHVVGCKHRCDGLGRPGIHDDEEELLDLDPEAPEPVPMQIDESDIETRAVDLFDFSTNTWTGPKRAPAPKIKPKAWRMTRGGIPYLPSTSTYDYMVFLFREGDTWTVGEKSRNHRDPASRLHAGLSFPDAVLAAEDEHPLGGRPPRKLEGSATEGQLKMLANAGVEIVANPTKQWASEQISDLVASRALDAR